MQWFKRISYLNALRMDLQATVDVNYVKVYVNFAKVDVEIINFDIFSNGGYLEFSTRLNFTILTKFYYSEALESDHAAYEILNSWIQWF